MPDPRENTALIDFLKAHSGRPIVYGEQCTKHPPMRAMLESEWQRAMDEHLGRHFSREWIRLKCAMLGIKMRGRLGKRAETPPEQKRAKGSMRWQTWFANLKKDPDAYEAYKQNRRAKKLSAA
ncbi:MAG: hypothetical protein AB7I50_23570 [Vicinamibacterales bacterium]